LGKINDGMQSAVDSSYTFSIVSHFVLHKWLKSVHAKNRLSWQTR